MKLSLADFPWALSTLTALTGYFFSPRGLTVFTASMASTARGAKKSSSLSRSQWRVTLPRGYPGDRMSRRDVETVLRVFRGGLLGDARNHDATHAARILELIEVLATLTRQSRPSLSTLVESCSAMNRQASLQANLALSTLILETYTSVRAATLDAGRRPNRRPGPKARRERKR